MFIAVLPAGTWQSAVTGAPGSLCACGGAACGFAAQPVHNIPACNKLPVRSPGHCSGLQAGQATAEPCTKPLCVNQSHGAPWGGAARPHSACDTLPVPRKQETHHFH